uniref:Uncharacterized protein n=1 Tax=Arundo donax TaxID=35708 RepID=A0A0A9FZ84_ARUDO
MVKHKLQHFTTTTTTKPLVPSKLG